MEVGSWSLRITTFFRSHFLPSQPAPVYPFQGRFKALAIRHFAGIESEGRTVQVAVKMESLN
jgi:hypothetical protein